MANSSQHQYSQQQSTPGPEHDQEEETDISLLRKSNTEKEMRRLHSQKDGNGSENADEEDEEEGITWGMREDAVEEEMNLQNLLEKRKPLELKDPKKTLKGFFDREGLDYEFEMDDRGTGHTRVYIARIRLPIEDNLGDDIYAEGTASKKKEAVLACAMEACKILDAHDMLRNVQHENERAKRAKELEANDFYDSDDDSFLDRTGTVETKRLKRMKRAGKNKEGEEMDTYESLKIKLGKVLKELEMLQSALEKAREAEKKEEDVDDLDMYMSTIDARMDKKTKMITKKKIAELDQEKRRLEKIIEIVRPAIVAEIKWNTEAKDDLEHKKPHSPPRAPSQDKNGRSEFKKQASTPAADSSMTGQESFKLPSLPPTKIPKPSRSKQGTTENETQVTSKRRTEDQEENQLKKKKKKKVYGAPTQLQALHDPDISEWTPPEGQSGDGKTHLNEKYGY